MQWRRAALGAALLALALAGVFWLVGRNGTSEPAPGAATPQAQADAAFARSLQGTQPDGDLRILSGGQSLGSNGPALPYAELKRLFDYYLSVVGEQSVQAIAQQIRQVLAQRLPAVQLDAANDLLARYLDYKRALVTLEQNPAQGGSNLALLRQRFASMQALRARWFSAAEDQAMFGLEDAYDQDALARMEVSQDPALGAGQKRERLAVLDAAMPATLRAERDAPRQIINVENKALEMRASGASDQDVFAMRAQALDPQAATRLAALDREEQAWKNRIGVYLSERSKLLQAQPDASASERQAALEQLQQSQFTPAELPRLAAYEP